MDNNNNKNGVLHGSIVFRRHNNRCFHRDNREEQHDDEKEESRFIRLITKTSGCARRSCGRRGENDRAVVLGVVSNTRRALVENDRRTNICCDASVLFAIRLLLLYHLVLSKAAEATKTRLTHGWIVSLACLLFFSKRQIDKETPC